MTQHRILLATLTLLAFWLRVAPRYAQVFGTPGLVNFTEADAWWHVRVIEHWARNFPHRLRVDAFGRIDGGQPVDTGPFFDLLPALCGWFFGLSTPALHQWIAWYPAVLGALLVPVTFLAARAIFGPAAGVWAAAIVATLPGHFLNTGSLGFADHHVMEALLTASLLYLLACPPIYSPVLLGAVLTAYLLTFPGGAFVVALVTLWYWLEGLRPAPNDGRRFAIACLVALPFTLWHAQLYLMRYSVAALALAAAGLWLLPVFTAWCHRRRFPRATYAGASLAIVGMAMAFLALAMPGEESLWQVLTRLTAANPLAVTVSELKSVTRVGGLFSLEIPWQQLGGPLVFSLIALPLLAESVWRRPDPAHRLFLLWSAAFFVMAMSQARMIYYFGVSAAILAGWLMSQLPPRSWMALALAAFLLLPNLRQAWMDTAARPGQISRDWLAALTYLRDETPRPFSDPAAFTSLSPGEARGSVLAWWDYGYWITTMAQRVPVTNPTQANAGAAADFFLATDEGAASAALEATRAQYVVLDHRLPFLGDENAIDGVFHNFFAYTPRYRKSDYLHDIQERDETGVARRRLFFRVAYFQTMLVRLYLAGGRFVPAPARGNFAVIELDAERLVRKQTFTRLDEAQQAARECARCELVSENPLTPCADLADVNRVAPAFASPTIGLYFAGAPRALVQVFAVR